MNYLLENVDYPKEYIYLLEHNFMELKPWKLMEGDWLQTTYEHYKEYFPDKFLVPFAVKLDWGDIAFFDFKKSGDYEIVILHDNDIESWERREIFESVWSWFKRVSDDFIDFAINDL